ncbi:LEAF RUST 10 DISEASE-RESISTANCE LOCUS RECEPTOR-LIKE PROTEIN KINASE-like 1.2 [Salvia divinorum]|uniref:LEAF RUST 10 DISEASE-RESISTANCE LOCUS RECEPTOR-LIKE PROTEIN KINASE-like 1.2 n=1 Tax=Salvia divinorum TaxID=28513 RepID=A0ABD1GYR8_SALDI
MESIARLLPLLHLITAFLFVSKIANSVDSPPPPSCAAFDCGNGLTLSYPFHLQIHHPLSCGYPNLAISCTNRQPILHISNNPYAVQNLSISDNSIAVAYGGGESCPIASRAVSLDHSESDYSLLSYNNTGNKLVRFYYNCTVYPPSAAGIKCLQRGAKHSYAFLEGSEAESDWMRHCESSVIAPVIESAVDDLRNGSGNAVKLGFKLTWELVDRSCKVLMDGIVRYHDVSGEVSKSKTSQPNYVAIGSVIFGGVMLTLTVVLFFIKMKIGVQKFGFNRLPTTYGK